LTPRSGFDSLDRSSFVRPWCNGSIRSSNLRGQGSNPWGRSSRWQRGECAGLQNPLPRFNSGPRLQWRCSFNGRTALCDSAELGSTPRHRPNYLSLWPRYRSVPGQRSCKAPTEVRSHPTGTSSDARSFNGRTRAPCSCQGHALGLVIGVRFLGGLPAPDLSRTPWRRVAQSGRGTRFRPSQVMGSSPSAGTISDGAARWLATGPENQGDRKVRGSIPPPSARSMERASGQARRGRLLTGPSPSGFRFEYGPLRQFESDRPDQCQQRVA
jgi:hypothetical protein